MKKVFTRSIAGGAAVGLSLALIPATTASAATADSDSVNTNLLSSPSSTDNRGELVEDGGYEYYEPGSAHGSSLGSSPISGAIVVLAVIAAGNFLVNEVPEVQSAIDNVTEAIGSSELSSNLSSTLGSS